MELAFREVSKTFGDQVLFNNLNFILHPGETVCIKTGVLDGGTTLLKMLAGLVNADSGDILLGGKPYSEHHQTDLFNSIAMCFEDGGVLDVFTNYNNIVLPILYHLDVEPSEIHRRIERIGKQLNLLDHMENEPFQLNDVQKRLLNLCKALVIEPRIIIIDELQSGMSNEMRDHVLNFLKSEQSQRHFSIVMTTTAGDRTDFADRTLAIANQSLIEDVA
jgi:ABC-type multidrug transport system ATPase subunit